MPTYGTTDRCTGGTVSASNASEQPIANLVDDDTGTTWGTGSDSLPGWVKYDFGVGVLWEISKVRLYMVDDNANPKTGSIEGSNNDSDWDELWSGTWIYTTGWQEQTFINRVPYRYIKLPITDVKNAGLSGGRIYCHEMEMYEGIYPASFLLNMMR